jgi:hypothetical protein
MGIEFLAATYLCHPQKIAAIGPARKQFKLCVAGPNEDLSGKADCIRQDSSIFSKQEKVETGPE